MIRFLLCTLIHCILGALHASVLNAQSTSENFADVSVPQIMAAWTKDRNNDQPLEIQWQHTERVGVSRFSQFQSHWAPRNRTEQVSNDNFVYRLSMDKDRFRFDSQRWAAGPHLEDFLSNELLVRQPLQYTAYVQKRAIVGNPFEYSSNLLTKFANPKVDFRSPQPFSRIFDGEKLIDTWDTDFKSHARVTIRKPMRPGSVAWARLTPEEDWNDQVDTLDMQAACLAFRRVTFPTINLREENLRLRTFRHQIDGTDCLVLDEVANNNQKDFRTFWLDPTSDFVIRRFIGTVQISHSQSDAHRVGAMPGRFWKTQIDIDYKRNSEDGWQPTQWSISAWPTHDYPMFDFSRSNVASISSITSPNLKSEFSHHPFPLGAWVIDETTGEQHIVKEQGAIRPITPEEISLLPVQEDLIQTRPGELLHREWESTSFRVLRNSFMLVGLLMVAAASAMFFHKRLFLS